MMTNLGLIIHKGRPAPRLNLLRPKRGAKQGDITKAMMLDCLEELLEMSIQNAGS